ncbi:ImmA/IrrE family metallo-endopeptidase [Bradyrhizobium oligotrophicum]|uniref:ImmA/IrrE family metallo-endopeptidase n=1 Tax=Bradyrhizobium oligotrophicum TaxID=44255 RepID=UPI003EBC69FD
MTSEQTFQPLWASAPGETISEMLRRRKIDVSSFASDMGESEEFAQCLLDGTYAIDRSVAERLHYAIGGSIAFWLNREAQYRDDVARIQGTKEQDEASIWLKELPLRDMRSFGWIAKLDSKVKQAHECLRFFGAESIAEWRSSISALEAVVAFRTSETFTSPPGAVAAWLRQGELVASKMRCEKWDREKFHSRLKELRKLTRIKDPDVFVPELQKSCAECGVATVVVRAPQGCRASGATKFLSPDKAMLLLSFRYRSDDHFWFTFFHEAGHLVLHDRKALFVEGKDFISTDEEDEADRFSEQMLVPPEAQQEMYELPVNYRAVMRFARKIGVSPGIVIGQLQHAGVIPPNRMNFLKTRFVWA